jgi:DNA-binding XRE family transcriptional regulator
VERLAGDIPTSGSNIGAIHCSAFNIVKLHFWSMVKRGKRPKNIVGPQVRKLRDQRGLTQEMFAARCSVLGLELSRATLSKIESQLRCVADFELVILAQALKVEITALMPSGRLQQS